MLILFSSDQRFGLQRKKSDIGRGYLWPSIGAVKLACTFSLTSHRQFLSPSNFCPFRLVAFEYSFRLTIQRQLGKGKGEKLTETRVDDGKRTNVTPPLDYDKVSWKTFMADSIFLNPSSQEHTRRVHHTRLFFSLILNALGFRLSLVGYQ